MIRRNIKSMKTQFKYNQESLPFYYVLLFDELHLQKI